MPPAAGRGPAVAGAASFYDLRPGDEERAALALSSESPHFVLLDAAGATVGYFCVGPGGARGRRTLRDAGGGRGPRPAARPGRGRPRPGLDAGRAGLRGRALRQALRVTVAAWNQPALRLAAGLGFRVTGGFGGFRHGPPHVILIADGVAFGA